MHLEIVIMNGIFNPSFYNSAVYGEFQLWLATLDRILDEGNGSFRLSQHSAFQVFEFPPFPKRLSEDLLRPESLYAIETPSYTNTDVPFERERKSNEFRNIY